ncbi:MAG TPA: STAS domain-containing protein [Iamia sp.]|nr:STAS domain-containing protein [Iamia sp.]
MTVRSPLDLVSTSGPGGQASLLLAGSLDVTTAPDVTRAIDTLVAQGATSLVVDLADLHTIDLIGVTALLAAGSALGGRVTIRGADALLQDLLAATAAPL